MHDACLKMMCCVHFLYYNYDIVLIFFFLMGTTCTGWWILGVSVMMMVVTLNQFVQVCWGVEFGCVNDDDGGDFKQICTSVCWLTGISDQARFPE